MLLKLTICSQSYACDSGSLYSVRQKLLVQASSKNIKNSFSYQTTPDAVSGEESPKIRQGFPPVVGSLTSFLDDAQGMASVTGQIRFVDRLAKSVDMPKGHEGESQVKIFTEAKTCIWSRQKECVPKPVNTPSGRLTSVCHSLPQTDSFSKAVATRRALVPALCLGKFLLTSELFQGPCS